MRIRTTLVAVAAIGAMFFSVDRAAAEEGDALFVGGGAAGLEIVINKTGPLMDRYPSLQREIPLSLPFVVLPSDGSPTTIEADLVGYSAGGVSARVLKATTIGSKTGRPAYARSTASIGEVSIPGTTIKAVSSECTWDRTGPRASTAIVDANGTTYFPPPNTKVPFPGGYIVLNEQLLSSFDAYRDLPPALVISVKGAHVHFVRERPDGRGALLDISIAFSSCDPLTLPSLSGLKLLQLPGGGG